MYKNTNVHKLGAAVTYINNIIGQIGAQAFSLAGVLIEFGLYLNSTILNSEVVQIGWRVVRDLANLGFTIGIVVIAYATMLGYESYGIKKTLLNFVIAAVMVNFSFSVAGFMIDGSNMVTHFFVQKSGGGATEGGAANNRQFATSIASAFGPQRLLQANPNNDQAFANIAAKGGFAVEVVLSTFFIALFTLFAALGMLAVGLTTFRRYVKLCALVIIMPMAILCSVFPGTKKHWNKWQTQFYDQLIYLPVATFAIYLVLMFVSVKSSAGRRADDW